METPPHLSFDLRRSNWFFRVKYLFGINGYISVDGWYKKCKFDLLQTNRTVKNWEDSTWLTRGQHWKYFNTLPSLMLLFSAVGDLGKKSAKLSNVKGISSLLLFFFSPHAPVGNFQKPRGIWHRHRNGASAAVVESLQPFFLRPADSVCKSAALTPAEQILCTPCRSLWALHTMGIVLIFLRTSKVLLENRSVLSFKMWIVQRDFI